MPSRPPARPPSALIGGTAPRAISDAEAGRTIASPAEKLGNDAGPESSVRQQAHEPEGRSRPARGGSARMRSGCLPPAPGPQTRPVIGRGKTGTGGVRRAPGRPVPTYCASPKLVFTSFVAFSAAHSSAPRPDWNTHPRPAADPLGDTLRESARPSEGRQRGVRPRGGLPTPRALAWGWPPSTHPELVQAADGGGRELGQQVVEQAQRGERVAHAAERGLAHALDEVALQVDGGQRVQPLEDERARRARQLAQPVLRQVEEGQRAQPLDGLRNALLPRALEVQVLERVLQALELTIILVSLGRVPFRDLRKILATYAAMLKFLEAVFNFPSECVRPW